ncbi:MAG TPA: 2-hydroxychromene-2-carboxylate isomerase [Burkholderiales bacterium]|nr:2-hydroxychromene-2-carboxylate isomerase [Burkholderiales bacterium]
MARLAWYFDFVSPFSYLQFSAYPEFLQRADIDLKPVLLAGLLNHFGQKGPAEIEPKRVHTYRYTYWQARKRGVAMKYPPGHPFNPLRALRLALAFGATYETLKTIFDFIWAEGRSPNDEWQALCDALGVPGAEVLAASAAIKTQLRDDTDEAARLGVFGVPTFVADGYLFWGIDATDMLRDYLDNPALFDSDEMKRLASLPVAAARTT